MRWIGSPLFALLVAGPSWPATPGFAQSGAAPEPRPAARTLPRAPSVAERIRHAAVGYRYDSETIERAARAGLAPQIVATRRRAIRNAAEADVTAVLIDAAARDPAALDKLFFRAALVVPEIAPGVARRLAKAMPRDAALIRETLRAAQALPAAGDEEPTGD